MNSKDFEQFLKHCQQVQVISDTKTVVRVKQTNQLIVLKKIIYSENLHNSQFSSSLSHSQQKLNLEQILDQQKQLYHENLSTVIDYCSLPNHPQQIIILTEYTTHSLAYELSSRKQTCTQFSQKQLENILISIIKALEYLQQRDIGHGCISLSDIYIDPSGVVKLVDPSMATNSPFIIKNDYYYSPELLVHNLFKIECSGASEDIDFFRNDIFVLGLNILELALFNSVEIATCINYSEGVINYQFLEDCLNAMEKNYGSSLTNLLAKMLQEDPQYRITIPQIIQYLETEFDQYNDSQILAKSKYDKSVCSFILDNALSLQNSTPESSLSSSESLLIQNPLTFIYSNARKDSQKIKSIRC